MHMTKTIPSAYPSPLSFLPYLYSGGESDLLDQIAHPPPESTNHLNDQGRAGALSLYFNKERTLAITLKSF